jgi:hypothetical protein
MPQNKAPNVIVPILDKIKPIMAMPQSRTK